jgi:hypothetical protein
LTRNCVSIVKRPFMICSSNPRKKQCFITARMIGMLPSLKTPIPIWRHNHAIAFYVLRVTLAVKPRKVNRWEQTGGHQEGIESKQQPRQLNNKTNKNERNWKIM